MIPIALDPAALPLAIVGRGPAALRRLRLLREAGADPALYSDAPEPALAHAAGAALRRGLPDADALRRLRALWIADLPTAMAGALAGAARAAGVLVNVEDRPAFCDFHSMAEVRRGAAAARRLDRRPQPRPGRAHPRRLAASFGPEWAARVEQIGARRAEWRSEGRNLPELAALTDAAIDRAGWLA